MTIYDLIFETVSDDTWDMLKDSEFHEERLLSLKDLDANTPCGRDCRKIIGSAKQLLARLSDAEQNDPDITDAIWRRVVTTCSVYWNG